MDIVNIKEQEEFNKTEVVKKIPMLTDKAIVGLLFFEKGQEMSLHKHKNCDEIIYVIEGVCEITIGDEKEKANKGNIVLAPMSVFHGIKNCSDKKLTILTIKSIECKQKEV